MEEYKKDAVKALKEWLVHLLNESNYCDARNVGRALEIVLAIGGAPGEVASRLKNPIGGRLWAD